MRVLSESRSSPDGVCGLGEGCSASILMTPYNLCRCSIVRDCGALVRLRSPVQIRPAALMPAWQSMDTAAECESAGLRPSGVQISPPAAGVAQQVVRGIRNLQVVGSSPTAGLRGRSSEAERVVPYGAPRLEVRILPAPSKPRNLQPRGVEAIMGGFGPLDPGSSPGGAIGDIYGNTGGSA